MIDCTSFRTAILADPQHPGAELRAHLSTCHDCTQYLERLMRFEHRLERALRVPVERGDQGRMMAVVLPFQATQPRTAGFPRRMTRRVLAIAASVVLGVVVAGGLWLTAPGASLAADVVGHMAEEPNAWTRTDVAAPTLEQVLRDAHVHMKPGVGLVSYANSCSFRGHVVPHLVVQTEAGPVTVMVLAQESLRRTTRFDEKGYQGMIVPVPGHGSLAVLERRPNTDMNAVKDVARHVLAAIEWTSAAPPT